MKTQIQIIKHHKEKNNIKYIKYDFIYPFYHMKTQPSITCIAVDVRTLHRLLVELRRIFSFCSAVVCTSSSSSNGEALEIEKHRGQA